MKEVPATTSPFNQEGKNFPDAPKQIMPALTGHNCVTRKAKKSGN